MSDIKGLHIKVTTTVDPPSRDLWLCFTAENGKSAMLSIAAIADRSGGIIGGALRAWAGERIVEHDEAAIAEEDKRAEAHAGSQFGMGA